MVVGVDTGLLLPWVLSEILALLTMTGRREVDEDRGVVGVEGVVRPVVLDVVVVAGPRCPDRVLFLGASLWALECWLFLATLDTPLS